MYRLAYDVVSNGVLWFAHHGLWDLVREPAFDRSWPDAWAAYEAVNQAFADSIAEDAPQGAAVLVQDYHLCLIAARLAADRPDLACIHFHHTPFAPPDWLRPLPEAHAPRAARGFGGAPSVRLPHRAVGSRLRRLGARHSRALAALDLRLLAGIGP